MNSATLIDYILIYVPQMIRLIALACVARWAIPYAEYRLKKALARIYPDELRLVLLGRLFSYLALFVIIAAVLHEVGLNISGLLGAAGIVGVAIGYASQTSIANIISGLFLMVERPFELGDTLVVDNEEGSVSEVNLFAITLRTQSGTVIRIPHEQLLKNSFVNLTRLPVRRHTISLKIDYEQDLRKVIELIKQVIKENRYCVTDHAPYVMLQEVSGHYVDVVIGAWGKQDNITGIKSTLFLELKDAFERAGIKMAVYKVCCAE